jgi:hypothetical protein
MMFFPLSIHVSHIYGETNICVNVLTLGGDKVNFELQALYVPPIRLETFIERTI